MDNQKKKNCNLLMEKIEALKDEEKINDEEYRTMMNDMKHIFTDEIHAIKYIKVLIFETNIHIFWDDGDDQGSGVWDGFCHDTTRGDGSEDDNPLRICHMSKRCKENIKILRVEPQQQERRIIGDDYIETRPYEKLKEDKYYRYNNTVMILLEDDLDTQKSLTVSTQTD